MKKLALIAIALLFSVHSKSEVVHYFKYGLTLNRCDILGEEIKPVQSVTTYGKSRFIIVTKVNGARVIKMLDYDSKKNAADYNKYNIDSKGNAIYLFLNDLNFELFTKELTPYLAFNSGTMTVPIKIRPKRAGINPFDFFSDVSLGINAGLKIAPGHMESIRISLLGGINVVSVFVDSTTTNGFYKEKSRVSSLTPTFAIVLHIKDFQIAGVVGWDYVTLGGGENWIFQGVPWYGVGLGYSFFSTNSNTNTGASQK